MKKIFFLILLLLFSFAAPAKETPWSAWRKAYTEFEKAEKARDTGNYLAAAQGFKKALELYQFVRQQRPDWNQKVILRRISDCKQELGKVEGFLNPASGASGARVAPSPVSKTVSAPMVPAVKADSPEVAALKQKIAALDLELQTLRQKERSRRDLESEIAMLIRDQHLAKERQAMLEEKLRRAEKNRAALSEEAQKELQNQLLQSKMECESLKGKLADMESRAKKAEAEAEKTLGQRKFAEAAIQATQEKLLRQERETADIRRAEEESRAARENLQKELDEIRKELSDTATELKEARRNLAETQEKFRKSAEENQAGGNVLAAENRTLSDKLAALQMRYDQLDAAFKELRQKMMAEQAVAAQMKSVAERSESVRRMLEKQQTSQEKQLKDLREETTNQMKEIAAAKTRIATLGNDLKTAVAQKEILQKRLQQRDAEDYRATADIAAKQKEWDKERSSLQEKIASGKGEIAKKEHLLKETSAQLAAMTRSRDQLVKEKDVLQQQLATLLEIQKQYTALQSNFSAAQKELAQCHTRLETAQKEHKELLALRQEQKSIEQLKTKLSDEERLSAELADANAALTDRLAEALKLKDEVVKLRAEAAQIAVLRTTVERLKAQNQTLAKYRDLEKELAAAKQNIIALESRSAKLDAALQQQTQDQQKIDALQQEINTAKQQLAAQTEILAESDKRNAAQKQTLDALRQESAQIRAEKEKSISDLQCKIKQLQAEKNQDGSLKKQSSEENSLREANSALQTEIAALQQERTTLQNNLADAQKARSQQELRLAQMEKSVKLYQEKAIPLQLEIDRLHTQIAALKKEGAKLAQLVEKQKLAENEIAKLRALNENLIQNHASGREIELLKTRLAEAESFRSEAERLRLLNQELRKENKDLELAVLRPEEKSFQFDSTTELLETPEVLISAGMRAEKENRLSTAIWNYENALRKDQHNTFAAKRLGILLLKREQFERASAALKIANRLAPDDPEVAVAAARCANACQRYGSALVYLEKLLKDPRPGMDALLVGATAYAGSGKKAKAEELLQLAVRYFGRQSFAPQMALAGFLADDATREEEALQLYESLRIAGAPAEAKLEIRFAGRLDERRELALFLNDAAEEAASRNDWATAVWYRRQAAEMKRDEKTESAQLAFARYMNGETAAALEELSLHRASIEGELVSALCYLRDNDRPAFQAALKHAKKLNRDQMIDLAVQWRKLLLELKKCAVTEKEISEVVR
ncbi:MAG: hypothetical protein MJ033_02400 [Victivallaceae bacterium]|nr:hypothetical protein [Victivallaceae bacterium]